MNVNDLLNNQIDPEEYEQDDDITSEVGGNSEGKESCCYIFKRGGKQGERCPCSKFDPITHLCKRHTPKPKTPKITKTMETNSNEVIVSKPPPQPQSPELTQIKFIEVQKDDPNRIELILPKVGEQIDDLGLQRNPPPATKIIIKEEVVDPNFNHQKINNPPQPQQQINNNNNNKDDKPPLTPEEEEFLEAQIQKFYSDFPELNVLHPLTQRGDLGPREWIERITSSGYGAAFLDSSFLVGFAATTLFIEKTMLSKGYFAMEGYSEKLTQSRDVRRCLACIRLKHFGESAINISPELELGGSMALGVLLALLAGKKDQENGETNKINKMKDNEVDQQFEQQLYEDQLLQRYEEQLNDKSNNIQNKVNFGPAAAALGNKPEEQIALQRTIPVIKTQPVIQPPTDSMIQKKKIRKSPKYTK